jgi:hypothetical protein
LTRSAVAKLRAGQNVLTKVAHHRIGRGLQQLTRTRAREQSERRMMLTSYREAVEQEGGIRAAARALGIDPSNLAKALKSEQRARSA